jgi:hypothetical protein
MAAWCLLAMCDGNVHHMSPCFPKTRFVRCRND